MFPSSKDTLFWLGVAILGIASLTVYPLHATFPVSHETPNYIMDSLEAKQAFKESFTSGIKALATNSWYPATTTLLLLTDSIIPLSWPTLIIWMSILFHVAIGLTLTSIAQQLHGKQAAVITLVLWTATFTIMRPILNGWLANWWSLLPAMITAERLIRQRYWQAGAFFTLTALTHPLSAFLLLYTGLLTLPALLLKQASRRQQIAAIILTIAFVAIGTIWLANKMYIFHSIKDSVPVYELGRLLQSPFAPAVIATPIGILWLIRKHSAKVEFTFLLMFFLAATWLTFNHWWLGANFLEWRFEPYLLLSLSITGGIGLGALVTDMTKRKIAQNIAIAGLLLGIMTTSWKYTSNFLAAYDGTNPLILLTEELEAINWLKQLPEGTHLVSTRHDLNYKWIPILTQHQWTGINHNEQLYTELTNDNQEINQRIVADNNFTHFVVLKERESDIEDMLSTLENNQTVYENHAVIVKQLSPVL